MLAGGTLVGGGAAAAAAPDPAAFLFVANNGNSVTEYAQGADGNATPIAAISGPATGLNSPLGLALDSAGDLFVVNFDGNSVTEYAPGASGNATPIATISGPATGLNLPRGIALDSAGDLFVANDNGFSVTEYASGASGNTAPVATISGPATGLNMATHLALDSAGDLFVANDFANTEPGNSVTEYAPGASGNATPIATISGPATGLDEPIGLGLDSGGDLFVTNIFIDSVTEYAQGASGNATPVTTISGPATGLNGVGGVALAPAADTDLTLSTPANITIDATGPSGASVTYPLPTVGDEDSPLPTAACSPASGTTFAIGTTTVNCSVTDPDDAPATVRTSFSVTVAGAAAQLASLHQAVQGVGPGTSLSDKIAQAQSELANGNIPGTCSILGAFVHEVQAQSGKHTPSAQAAQFIASAHQIEAVLGC